MNIGDGGNQTPACNPITSKQVTKYCDTLSHEFPHESGKIEQILFLINALTDQEKETLLSLLQNELQAAVIQ